MDTERRLDLLDQQIAEANGGDPADFNLWRDRTGVVLRNVLGDANPLYKSFTKTRYSLSVMTTSTPSSAHAEARRRGVRQVISVLEAAKLEVELSGGSPAPSADATGTGVFIVHGHEEALKHEVARFVRSATGNEPTILHEQPDGGRTVIEKFEEFAGTAGFAIVLATPDDLGRAKAGDDLAPRARQKRHLRMGFLLRRPRPRPCRTAVQQRGRATV